MLENSSLDKLRDKKNLLAFSAGVDSTALFFLLLKKNIKFDIAIVNYNQRKQAQNEITYAKELASENHLICYTLDAPNIDKNFEAKARKTRYDFFEKLIIKHKYDNLITAHHLGDRFEWMLMQFCKGAGCVEIAGMQKVQDRDFYTLIRPLLHLDKQELYNYLKANSINYFEDKSNLDKSIKRNSFRHNHSKPLLEKYLSGIKKSFQYIDEDRDIIIPEVKIKNISDLTYFQSIENQRANIFIIDKILKSKKYMLSAKERELLKNSSNLVVGRKFLISKNSNFIFISPYIQDDTKMSHQFKEKCRVLKVEPKLRPYLYKNKAIFKKISSLLS